MELNEQDKDLVRSLKRAIYKTFFIMCKYSIEGEPTVEKKDIIQWMQRYNVVKPVEYLYASVMTFRYGAKKSVYSVDGIIVVYYPEDVADFIFKYINVASEGVDDIVDACGEFCNIIAGGFKVELVEAGYEELDISVPVTFYGEVNELFEYRGDKQLEITYRKEGELFLMTDLAIDPKVLIKKAVGGDKKEEGANK